MHSRRGGIPAWLAASACQPAPGPGEHDTENPPWSRGRHGGWHDHPRGFGGPPWAALFGGPAGAGSRGGPRGFPPFGPWRATKARRGDVRTAVLAVLADGPRNGYQIIQEISERSGGAWKPSPGSVYPTLQQLEDEGLVQADQPQGRRTFELTGDGRAYADDHAAEFAEVWESASDTFDDGHDDMRGLIGQVMGAAAQVAMAGTSRQRAEAREVLADARRRLYGILAEDEPEGATNDA